VEFVNPLIHKYEKQYYHDKATLASANAVLVTPPNITSGIDAALQHAGTPTPTETTPAPTTANPRNPALPPLSTFAVLIRSTKLTVRGRLALLKLVSRVTGIQREVLPVAGV